MTTNFMCFLEINGVGYKATTDSLGQKIILKLGFSHDIQLFAPPSVRVFCPTKVPTLVCCIGPDKNAVTQFAALIRSCKPPEIYKGKGIRYRNEVLIQKEGKKK